MPSYIIFPFPKKSDAPSEKVKKSCGDLYDTENPLVATIDTVDKEGKSKQNLVDEANTSIFSAKKNTDTVDKVEISQTSQKQSLPPKKV